MKKSIFLFFATILCSVSAWAGVSGGEIYFDDVLVRKDGIFVIDELKGLNPENLK